MAGDCKPGCGTLNYVFGNTEGTAARGGGAPANTAIVNAPPISANASTRITSWAERS